MTPGRTLRDLRRLRGEESARFPKGCPFSAGQPQGHRGSSGFPRPAHRPLPGEPTLPLPPLQGANPPPPPARPGAWLPATPTSGLCSHNARRPPPGTLLTCPPAHVARPPARGEPRGPRVPACSPPERPPSTPPRPAAPRASPSGPRG